MRTAPGTFKNSADKWCWKNCRSCGRCSNKGMMAACAGCPGRFDMDGSRLPDPDDTCRCTEGILQYVKETGQLVQVRFKSNPFAGVVKYQPVDKDEDDWESYLKDVREKKDDENYDPIQFQDGTSTAKWLKSSQGHV